jgi:hypothetical protein
MFDMHFHCVIDEVYLFSKKVLVAVEDVQQYVDVRCIAFVVAV